MGVGGGEPRGGALQPLMSPSPSAPEVRTSLHHAAFNGDTAAVEQLLAAGAAVDALPTASGQGPRKRPVGTTGGGVEG